MKAIGSQVSEGMETFPEAIYLDDYYTKVQECRAQGLPVARLSSMISRGIEYGEVRCSFTVSIECPQTKDYMDQAAELLFQKALEYTNDGMSVLAPGVDRIEM